MLTEFLLISFHRKDNERKKFHNIKLKITILCKYVLEVSSK